MNKSKHLLFLCVAFFLTQQLIADPSHISGRIVNGRGGSEKCAGVTVKLYLNSAAKAYTVTDETGAFSFDVTGIANDNTAPGEFKLDQNYPNPFNKNTTIPYSLNTSGKVTLDIYDIRGHKVRSVVNDHRDLGHYSPAWNGKNDLEQLCPQGLYFYVLKMNDKTEIRKMTLMSGQLMMSTGGSQSFFAKPQAEQILELKIEDSDIKNKVFTQTYSLLPSTIELGNIPVHVYAYLKTKPDSLAVLEGNDVRDTLDIYFEKAFTLSSSDLDIEWEFNPDSSVSILYKNVTKSSLTLGILDAESYSSYSKINFELDPRASIQPKKLRRAYLNMPYSQNIKIENAQGNVSVTLKNPLPAGFTLSGTTLSGSTTTESESMLYFDLLDDRNVTMEDSALFIISDPEDVRFNDYVIDVLEEYYRDGRYPYSWVSGYHGVTQDLYYLDSKIASANPDSSHSTYCSGVTFEVYFRSITRMLSDLGLGEDINGLTYTNIKNFMSIWYVQSTLGDGPGLALQAYGLGDRIESMNNVIKGDFVQIWRTTGSGHSVIFMNWTTNTAGDTTGMRYWSTQTSTKGVNYNTEYFYGYGGSVDKAHTYYSRGRKPEDFSPF